MQRLQLMQNPYFGSKIKIKKKNMPKCILQIFQSGTVKKTLQKTLNVRQMGPVLKSAILSDPIPYKILTLGLKLKFQKTCENPFYNSFTVVRCKKPLQKPLNIREMGPISKSAITQKVQPMHNPHFGLKSKNSKTFVKIHSKNQLELFSAKNR